MAEDTSAQYEVIGSATVTDFGEPNYVEFTDKDGSKLWSIVRHRDSWARGVQVDFVWSDETGLGAISKSNPKFFKAMFYRDNHPIDRLETACHEVAITNPEMTECYHDSQVRWAREIRYLEDYIRANESQEVIEVLDKAHKNWDLYQGDSINGFHSQAMEWGGRERRIAATGFATQLSRDRFFQLLRFYN